VCKFQQEPSKNKKINTILKIEIENRKSKGIMKESKVDNKIANCAWKLSEKNEKLYMNCDDAKARFNHNY